MQGADQLPEGDYIFSGSPDSAVRFQTGDILGIYQPRQSRSHVGVYYDTSIHTVNYFTNDGNADQLPDGEDFGLDSGLPLLAVEICKFIIPITAHYQ